MTARSSVFLFLFFILASLFPDYAMTRSWYDLDRDERKIYGSEKEEKYPINAFFIEKEEWEDHHALMVMGLYKNTDYPKYSSMRFLPFYYNLNSKIDNRKMTVIPPLLSYFERDRDQEILFLLAPLYYSNVNRYGSDRSLLFLYWWGDSISSYKSDNYHFLFPLLYQESSKTKSGDYESFWINPLFVSYSSGNEKKSRNSYTWWAPILPLTYHDVDSYGGHRNIFWLLDYSWTTENGKDSMKRFWFLPLYLWGRGDDGYTYVLPPVYIKNRYSNGDFYEHLLPLYSRWKNSYSSRVSEWNVNLLYGRNLVTDSKTGEEVRWKLWIPIVPVFYSSTDSTGSSYSHLLPLYSKWKDRGSATDDDGLITPLYCSTEERSASNQNVEYSNFWFPIVPLFYSSYTKGEGTHRNLLLFFDWENDTEGNLKRFSVLPFVFHQSKDNGYRYYVPFYIRPSGSDEKQGMHFGLFHYHRWWEGGEKTWAWLYYHSEKTDTKVTKTNSEKVSPGETYTHFIPLYWDWKTSESEGTVILPLYFNYKDSDTTLHINLTGYARKTYMSPFKPDLTVGLQNKDNTWHLDSDISWLYDVWSFSSRIPIKNPLKKDEASGTSSEKPKENNTKVSKISDENKYTRENSHLFWGWKLLFGWMAYERSDDHKHFRMLPLAWINLTDKGNEKFIAILPFYVSYKSTELDEEYFTVVPFYGYQRKGKSYKRGVVLNLYWDEFDSEKNYREQTVLWPFINWYSSPDKDGYRFFPFVWHKSWLESSKRNYRTISLLHYNRKIREEKTGRLLYSRVVNPLYIENEKTENDEEFYSLNIPILPIFHYDSNRKGDVTETTLINPFFYRSVSKREKETEYSSYEFWAPLLPLYYYSRSNEKFHMNVLGLYDKHESAGHSHTMVFPVYYSSSNHFNETETVAENVTVKAEQSDSTEMNPLFYSGTETYSTPEIKTESSSRWYPVIPLYYSSEKSETLAFTSPEDKSDISVASKSNTFANPFYYKNTSETVINGSASHSETLWVPVIPLFYSHSEGSYRHWNLLGLIDHKEENNYRRNFFLPFYYGTETEGEKHTNILGIIDFNRNREGNLTHSMVLPFYYRSDDKDSSFLMIFPLLSGYSKTPGSSSRVILGTYWHDSERYERQNIYYLYDHKKYTYTSYESNEYSMLFTTIDYRTTRELRQFRMFWGALCNYKSYTNSPDYEFNSLLYLAGIERSGKSFHHRILPLYSYSSYGDDEWSLLIPPALSYFSESKDGDFDLGLLGLIYYRNENIKEKTDRRMWLLGSVYNEVREPERDYHAQGSMWGILWNYETEGETGFRKFSILKGLYKWVERDGQKKHTFLWVF